MELLATKLDWPITAENLEDATFEFTPGELGIDESALVSLKEIRQLRPLSVAQPWGIFFLEFGGARLRIGPLRRLLRALVDKKRSTGDGSRRTWALEDLLFVVATDSGENVELHLVAFFDEDGDLPEIRSVPWRPSQSPESHLRRVAEELLPRLSWPNQEAEMDDWRQDWREAFKLRHGEAIQSASRLAERMAETGRVIRGAIASDLSHTEPPHGFHALLAEVRAELVADVDQARFADMCAQTLVYGMLTSRITAPDEFGASPVLVSVPLANPFLAAFFDQVHDQVAELSLEVSGLDELVADLRVTNVEAILDQFGATAHGGDPVIHFYETFLALYDSELRADAGAFYTPLPIVRFMVRAVDDVLRSEFGLQDGIADSSNWRAVAGHLGIDVPEGVDEDQAFVTVIDPATGTGTFLVEWLRIAHERYSATHSPAEWSEQLASIVMPSMHGFESLLAPYAIAHLKIALEGHTQGVSGAEGAILLTDALEYPSGQDTMAFGEDPIAIEGEKAAALKRDTRFTVCIGNPPYDREQKASAEAGGHRKGGVVRYGVPSVPALLEDVARPMREAGLGKHVKNLYNDYVYFWRWATWQTTERIAGPGVTAFITASSYLDGVSMGGLRAHLRKAFDEIWIIDLGGDSRGAHPEENVFDIRTPVAICLGVRTVESPDCRIHYTRVRGGRTEKFEWLSDHDISSADWEMVQGAGIDSFLPAHGSLYSSWVELTDLFPWSHSGCQVKRTWPIAPEQETLDLRWRQLHTTFGDEFKISFRETRDRSVSSTVGRLLTTDERLPAIKNGGEWEACSRYAYRSFDRQWVIADMRVADFPRPVLWRTHGDDQLFLTTLTSTPLGEGPAVVASPYVPDLDHFRGSYGAKNVFPLYRDANAKEPNVTAGLLEFLSTELGQPVAPEDLATYVYALTATPAFTQKFAAEIFERAGAVRIPLTADPVLFQRAVALGKELIHEHTWGERFPEVAKLGADPVRERVPVDGYPEKFSFDADTGTLHVGSGEFGPVSAEVWHFQVSGLHVLRSWLGYRMADRSGRKSSPLDEVRVDEWTFSDELLRVINVLQRTIDLTPQASELLTAIVDGPLIDSARLPRPAEHQRRPPATD